MVYVKKESRVLNVIALGLLAGIVTALFIADISGLVDTFIYSFGN